MRIFLVKDNFGELHSVIGESVRYTEQAGRLTEARILDDKGLIVAVFSQWQYIKPGGLIPPPPPAPEKPN